MLNAKVKFRFWLTLAFSLQPSAFSADVGLPYRLRSGLPLAWNSPTVGATHALYAHTNALSAENLTNAVVRLPVGTNRTARVENLVPGIWYFAVTAIKNDIETDPSDNLVVEAPQRPIDLRTVVVQYNDTVTNIYHTGFFLLRLP